MTDTEAMHEALALAHEAADEGEVPVGCIVTDGEHIVGRGRNRRETGKSALADRKSTRLNSSHRSLSRMPSSA